MNYTKASICVFFLSFTINYEVISQIITILNQATKEPVENVALFNEARNYSILTDADGKANITNFMEYDSIFFQHPSYNRLAFTKHELLQNKTIHLSKRIFFIDEFVISASKSLENKRNVPFMIDVIDGKDLILNQGETSADILNFSGNLVVQKTQGGGGSPVLRGFEANKILIVIDGVRMNNAIYRSGHLQNAMTIDNAILDRAEVIFGPSSLIYGSDALGGVIHYYTRDPVLSKKDDPHLLIKVKAFTRYSSANKGKTGHLDFNIGSKKIGSLTSISYKDLGDIYMGKNKNPHYGDFGEVKHYVKQFNTIDSTVVNPDPYLQKNTGYSQVDLLQKFKYSPSENIDMILNLQYSSSSDIDRLDFLNDFNGQNLAWAEYYYGPQNRFFASLKTFIKSDNPFFTNMTSILAYQKIDEDRFTRRFGKKDLFVQKEDVNVITYNHDLLKILNHDQQLNYGIELSYNQVTSTAYYENIFDSSVKPGETRYPDGGTDAFSGALYGFYRWFNKNYVFAAGMRYQYSGYASDFNSGILPYNKIEINNGALTGRISMVLHPGRNWQINAIASTGFRNPNVDDYGKVRAKDGLVTVPNPDLAPEYTYNFELGVNKKIERYVKLNATAYYTYLVNAIVRTDFTINGSDSLYYDGAKYKIITNTNASTAYIRGFAFSVLSDLDSDFSFKSTLNLTKGRNITDEVPLAHIPPVFGRTSFTYERKSFNTELYIDYNGWKKIEDFSPLGEDNENEATIDGSPGWGTINLRTAYNINKTLQVQIAVENILDTFYKPFACGVSGAGRNFIITLRADIN